VKRETEFWGFRRSRARGAGDVKLLLGVEKRQWAIFRPDVCFVIICKPFK
jgi:hypothetical protein